LNSLEKKGIVKIELQEVERRYKETYQEEHKNFELTDQQSKIINKVSQNIIEEQFIPYLLHGVTGSGKTQVYIELSKKVIEKGKTVLILVPEISLTPQITSRFFNNFGDNVTVIHSRMSLGERYDTWRGIIKGKYQIVIGPRSALFAPLENIGLIIIDEEHDQSYKQYDLVPKYHGRDAAVIKGMFSNCPVVMGSATPSIEAMYNARSKKYELIELPDRVDNAKLPKIKLVDITIEKKKTVVSDKEYSLSLYAKEKNANSIKAKILKLLSEKETYKISYLQKLVKKKSIYSILKTLEKSGAVTILNEIEDTKVKIKKVKFVSLNKSVDEVHEILPEIERKSPMVVWFSNSGGIE